MSRWEDLVESARASPANVRFRDLCDLVVRIGYALDRKRGSHLIYRHSWRRDLPMVNLQEGPAGKAKPYQVRQIIGLIDAHKIEVK